MKSLPILARLLGLAAALAVSMPGTVWGQAPSAAPERILLRTIHGGWRHQDEPASPVPRPPLEERLELRETYRARDGSSRTVEIELGGTTARERIDWTGRVARLEVRPRGLEYDGLFRGREGMEQMRISRIRRDRGVLVLPSGPFRDIRIALPDTLLTPGDRWTDTLAFQDLPGEGLEESYTEVRRITVLRDTVLGERRGLVLRTDGEVRYEVRDVGFFGPTRMAIHRTASGPNVGTVVVDAVTGLRMAGADTAQWVGEAVVHDPFAGPLTSGATYRRVRGWRHFEPREYAAYRDSLREERRTNSSGMLITPRTELARRVAAGDARLTDSLVAEWRDNPDRDRAREARDLLGWAPHGPNWSRDALDSLDWVVFSARGDTARMAALLKMQLSRRTLTLEQARLLRTLLEAPERLWRMGTFMSDEHVRLAALLLEGSPRLEPDSAWWSLSAGVRRFWLDAYGSTGDVRIRDVALVGLFSEDPARWQDELQARDRAGSPVARKAAMLARGQVVEDGPSMPEAGSSWREWQRWWDSPGPLATTHDRARALRIREALTGRDPLEDHVAAFPPEEDSARVFMDRFLRAVGRLPELTPREILDRLLAGEPVPTRDLFLDGVGGLVREHGEPMDEAAAAAILEPLVASLLEERGLPWPSLREDSAGAPRRGGSGGGAAEPPERERFFLADGMPPSAVESLPPGVTPISRREWRLRDPRLGGSALGISPPLQWGPFVVISWGWTMYEVREPDQPPSGFAAGGNAVLVETPEGWRVVSTGSFIT